MRRRGQRVDAGSRLEYLIIETEDNFNDNTSEKMESADYFANHRNVLKLDFMYYLIIHYWILPVNLVNSLSY